MKRLLVLFLAVMMILPMAAAFSVPAMADMPSPEVIGGYENMCLSYTYRPYNHDYGQSSVEDFIPYVAYLDKKGNMQDFFFDSYLFLPYVTNGISGASIHGGPKDPSKAIDWVDYVNDTFCETNNVDALDSAMGIAKETLGDSERKAGVFFTILYPAYTATNFGSLGGKSLNLSKAEDRKYAIKWIIDEQIKLYTAKGYENLELIGFYWLEEEIYSDYDEEMMKYAADYLHSLGLKFLWIPWFQAPGYYEWKKCGFDLTCMQPNDMWGDVSNVTRVKTCASICKSYGMSMQIESDSNVATPDRYARYLRYLEGGITYGAMDSVKIYYQEGRRGTYYKACYSDNPTYRSVYDLTYKYAKRTLTMEDLYGKVEESDFEMPENMDWVSFGKSYTGTGSYVDGNGMGYQNVSGNELTDVMLGNSGFGTEWHAYHISLLGADGRFNTTIDLGEVYSDLTHVIAQFWDNAQSGVRAPADVKIYISEDGEDFDLLSKAPLAKRDDMYYVNYVGDSPFSARYVKLSFLNSSSNFVFCSEIMVGKEMEEAEEPIGSVDPDSSDLSDEPAESTGSDESDESDETDETEESSESAVGSEEISDEAQKDGSEDESKDLWLFVRIGVSALLIVALAIIFFMKRSKKKN